MITPFVSCGEYAGKATMVECLVIGETRLVSCLHLLHVKADS